MFKVNNKDTRKTPMATVSIISTINLEHAIASWVISCFTNNYIRRCSLKKVDKRLLQNLKLMMHVFNAAICRLKGFHLQF